MLACAALASACGSGRPLALADAVTVIGVAAGLVRKAAGASPIVWLYKWVLALAWNPTVSRVRCLASAAAAWTFTPSFLGEVVRARSRWLVAGAAAYRWVRSVASNVCFQ